jgi:hypothetical protein
MIEKRRKTAVERRFSTAEFQRSGHPKVDAVSLVSVDCSFTGGSIFLFFGNLWTGRRIMSDPCP